VKDDFESYIAKAINNSDRWEEPCFFVSEKYLIFQKEAHYAANLKKRLHGRMNLEELKVATQFFTPVELVKFVADNSLARLIAEKGAKNIRIFDPAAGTGNMLFYACRILKEAYEKEGLDKRKIVAAIEKNVSGADIDRRASSVAERMIKKYFGADIIIRTPPEVTEAGRRFLMGAGLEKLIEAYENLSARGSLQNIPPSDLRKLKAAANSPDSPNEIKNFYGFLSAVHKKYDVILLNPPYLASSDLEKGLLGFLASEYSPYKADLFGAFIAKFSSKIKSGGYIGVVCPYNWMFIKQFMKLREKILQNNDIITLAMLGTSTYRQAVVYLSAFVLSGGKKGITGKYIKCSKSLDSGVGYEISADRFYKTPYKALIFWTGEKFIENYSCGRLSDVMEIRQGMATGDNKKYLKKISDVSPGEIDFSASSLDEFISGGKKYALYEKGGVYRKWFGNRSLVILFDDEARKKLAKSGNRMPSRSYYFKPAITWTLVSSKGHFGARLTDNSVFDVGGSCGFPKDPADIYIILAYLCSNVATYYLNAQNPTLNCQVGDLKKSSLYNSGGRGGKADRRARKGERSNRPRRLGRGYPEGRGKGKVF